MMTAKGAEMSGEPKGSYAYVNGLDICTTRSTAQDSRWSCEED
jgi:hypothetical protein